MNRYGLLTALAISSISFSSSAQNVTDAFSVTNGEPAAQNCQLSDIGSSFFDPESGRLWACGNQGWVFFESQMPNKYACLDVKKINAPEWKKARAYKQGTLVTSEGRTYKAAKDIGKWRNYTFPKNAQQNWIPYAGKNNPVTRWNADIMYKKGSRVVYMGIEYKAIRWVSSNRPGEHANWEYIGPFSCPKS
ncbi:hypothetical protein Q8W40_24785 [Vibrio penaeicida]|uniref:hypothetical protein n=1 Tax=Vibrio penaeicida TaxID=104609 RepID=UPI002734076B|nr:hypothetical protein [Vibrio penaeicida]MDP2575434.1 hypothetical protein [Vibrio penaeicida]